MDLRVVRVFSFLIPINGDFDSNNGELNENFGLLYKRTAELLRNATENIKSVVALLYKLTKYFGL